MIDLNTRDLLIVSMYQQGSTPAMIGLSISIPASTVRARLKSPEVVAYQLDQEEMTDQFLQSLYHDGAIAIRSALRADSIELRLKGVKLLYESIGKIRPKDSDLKSVNVQNILNVMTAAPSPQELQDIARYLPDGSNRVIDVEEAVPALTEDCE